MDPALKLLIASKVNWQDRILDSTMRDCLRLVETLREVRTLAYQLRGGERIHEICTQAIEAHSSTVEHRPLTPGVDGSNPSAPANEFPITLVDFLRYHGRHCLSPGSEQSITMLQAADEIERLSKPTYLQGNGGWFALSLGAPRFCFWDETLDGAKNLVERAIEFHKKATAA